MPPKMTVAEKFYSDLEKELEMMPDPVDDVEAFLNCARYNENDDGQLLREYLDQHPEDVDARDAQGRTAMHMAAANGHLPIMQMLLEFGPIPDAANNEGNTALHFAALNNKLEAARLLIERGWKASTINSFCRTPLQMIQDKRFDEMEALLLEHDDSLDAYELPNGASVDVAGAGASSSDEDEGEAGVGSTGGATAGEPQPQHSQRAAPSQGPTKQQAAPAKKTAPQSGKKQDEGVLGTTTLDGIE